MALAEDLGELGARNVLAGVRAGDEVDRLGRQAGAPRVAGREIADPEPFLELLQPGDRPAGWAQLAAGDVCQLVAETLERGERVVDQLHPGARADVHEHLLADP